MARCKCCERRLSEFEETYCITCAAHRGQELDALRARVAKLEAELKLEREGYERLAEQLRNTVMRWDAADNDTADRPLNAARLEAERRANEREDNAPARQHPEGL